MRRHLWTPMMVTLLTLFAGVVWAQNQPVTQVLVAGLPGQDITQDQAVLNPVPPGGGDPTCQSNLLCTSWQTITGSTIGPINVANPSTLLLTFMGSYDCDGCIDAFGFPFTQIRAELSTNGDPFTVADFTGFGWATYIPNSGANMVLQRAISVGKGGHTIRMQHRFTVDAANNPFLTGPGGRLGLRTGSFRLDVLK